MAEVYRARDVALERDVAIKVLPPDAVGTPEKRRRFDAEAKILATLSHPSIVPVYDIGESGGTPFIVQELVAGETVDELILRKGSLPVDQVAQWGMEAAEGLGSAHEAGILHRDIKPGNLIIDADGRLRILDFGLAKILERPGRSSGDGPPLTSDGMVVGTVHYMSPEQAQGHEIDERTDIFSLGIVLYEMATGHRPFKGEAAVDVMHAIVYDPAAPVDSTSAPLPDGFVAILEKALEKRPDERYQSIREMSADLRRFLRRSRDVTALGPLLRPSASTPAPVVRDGGRWRLPLIVAVIAAAIVVAVLAAGGVLRPGRKDGTRPSVETRVLLQSDYREEEPVFSPDGKGFAYTSNEGGHSNIYYRLFSSGSPIRLTEVGGENHHPVFTPDGGTIFFAHEDPATRVRSIQSVPTLGGPIHRILEEGDEPALSKDGRRLLFIRPSGQRTSLVVANTDGSSQKTILDGKAGVILGARFSNDGTFIAFLWQDTYPADGGELWRIPSGGGEPLRLTVGAGDVAGHVEFLPDDSAALFSCDRTGTATIWKVPARGGEAVQVVPSSSRLLSPSISPDGRSLLVQSRRFISDAWEFSLPDGRPRQLTNCGSVWAPARLPDGRLLYGDWSRPGDNLDIYLEEDGGTRVFIGKGGTMRPPPDGLRIYFSQLFPEGTRSLTVMDTVGGPPRRITNSPGSRDDWPDPSPDERRVVFVRTHPDGKNTLCSVDVVSGATETLLETDAIAPRATSDGVLFRSCQTKAGCGVFFLPRGGTAPRLLIPDGNYPAVSRDGETVFAWAGPKNDPHAVSAPLDGGSPVTRLFDFNAGREIQFWAVHTLDVSPDGRSLVATRQWINDDILLMEGVFR